jgi:hypothetical protein
MFSITQAAEKKCLVVTVCSMVKILQRTQIYDETDERNFVDCRGHIANMMRHLDTLGYRHDENINQVPLDAD